MDLVATFEVERAELMSGKRTICGIDEAGCGPLAGPVVAAAVVLDADELPEGIADSKIMQADARQAAFERIMSAAEIGVGIADVERIDRDNILQARLWAMQQAVSQLRTIPCVALVDGNRLPKLRCEVRGIVKGDSTCLSIAAASIVAKVTRDRIMTELGAQLPAYGFERHKGYSTPEHRAAIARLGVTVHHRRSFRPVQDALNGFSPVVPN